MSILPEAFVRSSIRDLEAKDKALDGFVSVGNEIERRKMYREWIVALKEYYSEHSERYAQERIENENIFQKRILEIIKKNNKRSKRKK